MRARLVLAVTTGLLALASSVPATGQDSPPDIAGLSVTREELREPSRKTERREYLSDIVLYSLRRPDGQLEGTLQVGRFRGDAPSDSTSFRRSLAAQVGTTVPIEQRVDATTTYVTKGKRLVIVAWFRERRIFILSIREDFESPKTLIRQALGVEP